MAMIESTNQLAEVTEFVFMGLEKLKFHKSCIDGSAILQRVLWHFEVREAYLLPVNVRICNASCMKWLEGNELPDTDAEYEAFEKADCFMINVGKLSGEPEGPGHWPGHLTVVVPDLAGQHVVLDLTIVQAERPEFGIRVNPMMFPVGEDFLNGEAPFTLQRGGLTYVYLAYPDDLSYLDDDNTASEAKWEHAAQQILQFMALRGFLKMRPE